MKNRYVVSGLWPSVLQSGLESGRRRTLDMNLVDHFIAARHDGSMITWAHAANSRERLKQALMSTLFELRSRAGSGVVRIDPLYILAGCSKRGLNQALSVLSLSLRLLSVLYCCLLGPFCGFHWFVFCTCSVCWLFWFVSSSASD